MKKTIILLVAILVISLLGSSVAFAVETETTRGSLETLIERIAIKHDERIDTRTELYNERITKAVIRVEKSLEIVNTVNPDLLDDFTALQQEHASLHETMFNLNISLRTASYDQFIIDLTEYYNLLLEQVTKDEITPQEMRENIRTFLEEKRSELIATIEEYQATIADAKAANELVIEQLKASRITLLEALDNKDLLGANTALTNIMGLMVEHISFDSYKLTVLQNFPF